MDESLFIRKQKEGKGFGVSQRVFLRKNRGDILFVDSDRDGVVNGLDCYPHDKKKHAGAVEHLLGVY